MVLGAILSLTVALTEVSGYRCAAQYVREDQLLASTSLLGCYDRSLFERYGILALCGSTEELTERWKIYFESPMNMRTGADRMQIKTESVSLDLDSLCYSDLEYFRNALLKTSKASLPGSIGWKDFQINHEDMADPGFPNEHESHELKNEGILQAMPSGRQDVSSHVSIDDLLNRSIEEIIENSGEEALINLYLIRKFGNALEPLRDTYFRSEQEYILCGKTSDEANEQRVKTYLIAFRTALNLAYLELSPIRQEEAMTLAALLTGPGAIVTAQTILAGWAAEEGVRDVNRLLKGERVVLMPTDETWMKQEDTGYDYQNYLTLLLFVLPVKTKWIRMQDLMQINTLITGNGAFDWSETYAGFSVLLKWKQKNRIFLPGSMRVHTTEEKYTYAQY